MAKTDAKQRRASFGGGMHKRQANARLRGIARAGGQHDGLRAHRHRLLHIQRIVAAHDDFCPKLAQIMHEVIGETIVVIDQEQHGAVPGHEIWGYRREAS